MNKIRLLAIFISLGLSAPVLALDLQLEGKKAIVTGSTGGIGYGIARALLNEGAVVVVNGRQQESVDQAIDQLQEETGATALGFAGDMSLAETATALYEAHPDAEIIINNVGGGGFKPFYQATDEDWLNTYQLNVMSGVRLSRHYLPDLMEKDWGRIIFISSESGYHIPAEGIAYGAAKAAEIAVARGLAEMTKGTAVTVNSVLPGPTMSRGLSRMQDSIVARGGSVEEFEENFFTNMRPTSLLQRFTTVDEVAAMVVYIASPLASGTNGAPVRDDGGTIKSAF